MTCMYVCLYTYMYAYVCREMYTCIYRNFTLTSSTWLESSEKYIKRIEGLETDS